MKEHAFLAIFFESVCDCPKVTHWGRHRILGKPDHERDVFSSFLLPVYGAVPHGGLPGKEYVPKLYRERTGGNVKKT